MLANSSRSFSSSRPLFRGKGYCFSTNCDAEASSKAKILRLSIEILAGTTICALNTPSELVTRIAARSLGGLGGTPIPPTPRCSAQSLNWRGDLRTPSGRTAWGFLGVSGRAGITAHSRFQDHASKAIGLAPCQSGSRLPVERRRQPDVAVPFRQRVRSAGSSGVPVSLNRSLPPTPLPSRG
jgi:hypothetical protein